MESLDDTLEVHLHRHTPRGRVVYLGLLGCVILGLAALPLVRVDIGVEGIGMIRTALGQHDVQAPTSGLLGSVEVRPHQHVEAGGVLVRLTDEPARLERLAVVQSVQEIVTTIEDLERLLSGSTERDLLLEVPALIEEHAGYVANLEEVELRLGQARSELRRVEPLFSAGLVPSNELEENELSVSRLERELEVLQRRHREEWQRRLRDGQERLRDLEVRLGTLRAREERLTVRSPVAGSVEELGALSPGSFVQAGKTIARISPVDGVFAEVMVPSRDIGLLTTGLPARLLVDAYNFNDWGALAGKIIEISEDVSIVAGEPRFRVLVGFEHPYLELRNGIRGEIRKGMTVTARFIVSDRTLWQLLRDDINRWLNPLTFPA